MFCEFISYLLTPRSRVLPQKLTSFQLIKKFPATLTYTEPARSNPGPSTSHFLKIHLSIRSYNLRPGLPSGLFLSGFPTENLYTTLLSPIRATCPTYLILLDFITRKTLGEQYRSLSSSLCSFLHFPITSSLLGQNILLSTLFSNFSAYVPPSV